MAASAAVAVACGAANTDRTACPKAELAGATQTAGGRRSRHLRGVSVAGLGCSCAPACHLERLDELLDLPDLNVGIILDVLLALLLRHAHLAEVQTALRLAGAALSPERCSGAGEARIAWLRWYEAARGAQRGVRVLSPVSSSSCRPQSSLLSAERDCESFGGGLYENKLALDR